MKNKTSKQSGFAALAVLIIVILAALAGSGWLLYKHHKNTKAGATDNSQSSSQQKGGTTTPPPQNVYAGWKTYSSSSEKATFQYPNNWTVTNPAISSNNTNNTDQIGIKSPTGAITVSWVSDLTGFGNETNGSYPQHIVTNKTAITNASGYYVVSGITTLDGSTYYPWLAVQDSQGILSNGVKGDLATFTSKHATNPSTGSLTGMLFATCGARTFQDSSGLTQAQATAWFSGSEAQQAKLILLSLSDSN